MLLSSHLVLALNEQVQDILSDLVVVFIEELVNLKWWHHKWLENLSGISGGFPFQQVLWGWLACVESCEFDQMFHKLLFISIHWKLMHHRLIWMPTNQIHFIAGWPIAGFVTWDEPMRSCVPDRWPDQQSAWWWTLGGASLASDTVGCCHGDSDTFGGKCGPSPGNKSADSKWHVQ